MSSERPLAVSEPLLPEVRGPTHLAGLVANSALLLVGLPGLGLVLCTERGGAREGWGLTIAVSLAFAECLLLLSLLFGF